MNVKSLILVLFMLPCVAWGAFPTEAANPSQAEGFRQATSIADTIKKRAESLKQNLQAGDYRIINIVNVARSMDDLSDRLDALKTIPGIAAYAQDQISDPSLDLAAEFNAMQAAVNAFIEAVKTSLPRDAQSYVQDYTVTGAINDIVLTYRELSPAQTAPLVPLLQAIVDSIQ